jgi:hypothetical protein
MLSRSTIARQTFIGQSQAGQSRSSFFSWFSGFQNWIKPARGAKALANLVQRFLPLNSDFCL